MSRWISLLSLLLLLTRSGFAAEPRTLEVGKSPESVCRGFDGKLFITLIGGDEPGDGKIARLDGDKVSIFTTGLNAPKGLVFIGDYLVTADETVMWKIDKSGTKTKLVDVQDFPAPIEFLNDVAASHDGTSVYVSEMSNPGPMFDPSGERKLWAIDSEQGRALPNKGCVYKVTLTGKVSVAVPSGAPELRYPNGVAVDESQKEDALFVGDFFSGNLLSYQAGKFRTIATGMRGIDGLTVLKETCYASSWNQGKVWKVDRQTGKTELLLEGLKTAADFYYDAAGKQLIIPDMVAGTLVFLPLK